MKYYYYALSDGLGSRKFVRHSLPLKLRNSGPEPDAAIVVGSRNVYKKRHATPYYIIWVAEISKSTISNDCGLKRKLYATEDTWEF